MGYAVQSPIPRRRANRKGGRSRPELWVETAPSGAGEANAGRTWLVQRPSKKEAPRRALGLETGGRPEQGDEVGIPLMHPICFSRIASALAAPDRAGSERGTRPAPVAPTRAPLIGRVGGSSGERDVTEV